jgi:hypothetical protein
MESAVLDRPAADLDLDVQLVELPAPQPHEFEWRGWESKEWAPVGEPGLAAALSSVGKNAEEVLFVRRRGEGPEFCQVAGDHRRGLLVEFRDADVAARFGRLWTPGMPERTVLLRLGHRGYLWHAPRAEVLAHAVALAAIVLFARERRVLDGLSTREPSTGAAERYAGIRWS